MAGIEDFLGGGNDQSDETAGKFGGIDSFLGDAKPRSSLARRALGDTAVSALKGAIGLTEVPVGLADLATGGRVGKALEDVGYRPKQAKSILDEMYSPEQKAANKAVQEADGFIGTTKAALQNPSTIGQAVVESAPLLLPGAAAARGLGAVSKLSPAVAAGVSEGIVGAGQSAEQMRQNSDNGLLSARQSAAALASGAGTATFGIAGGKIAQSPLGKKLGIADIDTTLAMSPAQRAAAGGVNAGLAKRVAGGAVSEGVLEELPQSMWEQAAQNYGEGKDMGDGVASAGAMGMLAGGAMGGGFNALQGRHDTNKQADTAPEEKPLALPAPTYTGTPSEQLTAADVERENAVAEAEARNSALWAARDEYEASRQQGRSPTPVLITDPEPLQQRINEMLGIDQGGMTNKERKRYAKELQSALDEQVAITNDENGIEVPLTMADYLESQVSAADSARWIPFKEAATRGAEMRAQQLSDEEAATQPDIQPAAQPAKLPVTGPLSSAVNVGVDSGATTLTPMQSGGFNAPSQMDALGDQGRRDVGAGSEGNVQPLPAIQSGGSTDAGTLASGVRAAGAVGNAGGTGSALNAAQSQQVAQEAAQADGAQAGLEQGAARQKIENEPSLNKTASWIIRNKETGQVVMETFDKKKVKALNAEKYEAVPIGEYLGSINGQIKQDNNQPEATPTSVQQQKESGNGMQEGRRQEEVAAQKPVESNQPAQPAGLAESVPDLSDSSRQALYESLKDRVTKGEVTLQYGQQQLAAFDEAVKAHEEASSVAMESRAASPADKEFTATEQAYGGRDAYERAKASGATKLNYRQWVQVRTPAFKEWFGDWETNPGSASKVINPATGEPLVVYHGTNRDFNSFDKNSKGKTGQYYGDGFYFTDAAYQASGYADNKNGGSVVPVYLNITNPFIEDVSELNKGVATNSTNLRPDLIKKLYENKGFDGVFLKRGWQIAFDPTQIKSATGNNGNFDSSNPDIRESRTDRSSIDTAVRRMDRFVSEFERGTMKDSDTQSLGETPTVLQFLGADNLQMQIDGATVRKVLAGKHRYDVSPDALRNVVQAIYDPLAVFRSATGTGLVVLSEVQSNNGNPVVAAIHLSKRKGGMVINDIASVHEKTDAEKSIGSWVRDDLLRYVRNENNLSGAATRHLLPASVATLIKGHMDNVATETDVVKQFGPRYSFSSNAAPVETKSLNAQQKFAIGVVEKTAERFRAEYAGAAALDIRTVYSRDEIPTQYRPSPYAEGVYHDRAGIIYLIASKLPTRQRTWQVLMHETVGHYGMANMMGDKFSSLWSIVLNKAKAGQELNADPQPGEKNYETVEAVRRLYPDASDAEVAQEVLARMAETMPTAGWFQMAMAKIRVWMKEAAKAFGLKLEPTMADVRRLVTLAGYHVRSGANLEQQRIGDEVAFASQGAASQSSIASMPDEDSVANTQSPNTSGDVSNSGVSKSNIAAYADALSHNERRKALRILHQAAGIEDVDHSFDRGANMHAPSGPEDGSPLYDVSKNGTYPEDVYSSNGLRYYGTGEDRMDSEAYRLIKQFEAHPNMPVTIYRSVESDGSKSISPGDWVTIVKEYAKDHGEAHIPGGFKIISKSVKARDIFTSGDSWLEWGYHPQRFKPEIPKGEKRNTPLDQRIANIISNESSAPEGSGAMESRASTIDRAGSFIDQALNTGRKIAGRDSGPGATISFPDLDAGQRAFLGKIGGSKTKAADTINEAFDRAGLKIRQGLVDRYAALKELDEKAIGKDFINTGITDSSWVLAKMSSAGAGALNAMMNTGRIAFDAGQRLITLKGDPNGGLMETLKKLGPPAELERFFGWIAANRAEKLMEEGREHLFTDEEIAAGKRMNMGKTEDGKSRPALYAQVFSEFSKFRDDVVAIAEQTGVISAEERAMWKDEFYVPFYRVMEEDQAKGPGGSKGLSRQEAYKKLKGGKQNLNDLMENTLMNFHHLLSASLKNQAAAQAVKNAEKMGIARKVPESKRDTETSTFVLEKGNRVFYQIDDPLVYESITSLSDPGLNNFAVRVMSAFKRVFTNMTTVTPQFVVANTFRDLLQASATSPTSKNILTNAKQGAKAYRDQKTRAEMLAAGAAFSFGHIYGSSTDEIKASLRKNVAGANLISDPSMIPEVLRKGWDRWSEITDTSENITRAATYVQNAEQLGKLRAAFEARDIMDFSQHGAWPAVRFMIRVVPFLNARLQGLDKLYRSGAKPALMVAMGKGTATDKQAAARFATVTGALVLASLALYMANADDDEYKKLEEWQKDTYWPIRIGNQWFFLPKPFEVGSIATMAERTAQQMMDDKATGDLFKERMWNILMQTFAFNPTPQLFQPMIDVYSNKDAFTGRDIETMGMERLSKGLRARDTTTAAASAVSAASRVFGDDAPFAVSPVQADHLIKGYLGSVGANAAGMIDTIWRTASGEEAPSKAWSEYQPIKRFYRDLDIPSTHDRYSTLFYDGLREANKAYADVMELQKLGRFDDAQEMSAEKRGLLSMRHALNHEQRVLSGINKRIQDIRRSDRDGDQKRQEIDRLTVMKNVITERNGKLIESARAAE